MVVHLAFLIFGSHEETRESTCAGRATSSRPRSRRAPAARLHIVGRRLRVPHDNPECSPRTSRHAARGTSTTPPRRRSSRSCSREIAAGAATDVYVFRPCIVAGRDAPTLIEGFTGQKIRPPRAACCGACSIRCRCRPVLPDSGVPFQLVHHDDVANAVAPRCSAAARRYLQPRQRRRDHRSDVAHALGWHAVRCRAWRSARRQAGRAGAAAARRGGLDRCASKAGPDGHAKARRELRWRARHDAARRSSRPSRAPASGDRLGRSVEGLSRGEPQRVAADRLASPGPAVRRRPRARSIHRPFAPRPALDHARRKVAAADVAEQLRTPNSTAASGLRSFANRPRAGGLQVLLEADHLGEHLGSGGDQRAGAAARLREAEHVEVGEAGRERPRPRTGRRSPTRSRPRSRNGKLTLKPVAQTIVS